MISGRKYWADGALVAGQQFEYGFDDIGNRETTGGRESAVSDYTVNRLNQYSQRTNSNKVDVLGIANPTAGVTVGVSGGTAYTASRKGEYYHYPLNVGNNVYPTIEAKSLYGATETKSGEVFNPPAAESYTHDLDGNLTSDGRWTYVWDGENRLIEMKRDTSTPTLSSRLRMTFEYDHQGRRIRKIFFTHNGSSWVESTDTVFLYDGWNLMGELNANSSNAKLRTYIWGMDLSGSEQGAGGVGGLLKVTDYTSGTTHHFAAYDGNGNVGALVDGTSGGITARYEYGPFGEPLRATGSLGEKNPIRFSSKYTDDHSGLLYYGYRYYNPVMGRWLNRDPVTEAGALTIYRFWEQNPSDNEPRDVNEYCFLLNSAVDWIDLLGLLTHRGDGTVHLGPEHLNFVSYTISCPVGTYLALTKIDYSTVFQALIVYKVFTAEYLAAVGALGGPVPGTPRNVNCVGQPVTVEAHMRTRLIVLEGRRAADLYAANIAIEYECRTCLCIFWGSW